MGLGQKDIEEGPVIVEESEDDSSDKDDKISPEENERMISNLKKDIGAKLAQNIQNKLKAAQLKKNFGGLLKGKI